MGKWNLLHDSRSHPDLTLGSTNDKRAGPACMYMCVSVHMNIYTYMHVHIHLCMCCVHW
uniref:Uncharacterized protein n=1 Tax=Anguilla anguilla TaxID=7936 RepID=A0A0E9RB84_ANGAN